MRPMRIVAGLALGLGFTVLAVAQPLPGKDQRRIEIEEATVYSAPGAGTLWTGVLRRGAVVEVRRQREDGWLEIAPPEGSFSWVNDRFVQRLGGGLKVTSRSPVPLRVGSVIQPNRPTNAVGGEAQYGTQLVPLKPEPVQAEGGRWWPVLPNPSEKRYLHLAALNPQASAVAGKEQPAKAVDVRPSAPEAVSRPRSDDQIRSLWQQAQDAERTGNLADAIRAYDEVARATNEDALRILALNRAEFLRNSPRGTPRTPPVRQSPVPAAPVQPRGVPDRSASPPRTSAAAPAIGGVLSGVGQLERTAFSIDGRPAYALVSSEGLLRMYVTAEDGVELKSFVRKNVEVTGTTVSRDGTNYMRVRQVKPLQ